MNRPLLMGMDTTMNIIAQQEMQKNIMKDKENIQDNDVMIMD